MLPFIAVEKGSIVENRHGSLGCDSLTSGQQLRRIHTEHVVPVTGETVSAIDKKVRRKRDRKRERERSHSV